jgi:hypothetical protein
LKTPGPVNGPHIPANAPGLPRLVGAVFPYAAILSNKGGKTMAVLWIILFPIVVLSELLKKQK